MGGDLPRLSQKQAVRGRHGWALGTTLDRTLESACVPHRPSLKLPGLHFNTSTALTAALQLNIV